MAPSKLDLDYPRSSVLGSRHVGWLRQRKRYKPRLRRGGSGALLIQKVTPPPKQQAWLNTVATCDS
jgi:hypothetical protein